MAISYARTPYRRRQLSALARLEKRITELTKSNKDQGKLERNHEMLVNLHKKLN